MSKKFIFLFLPGILIALVIFAAGTNAHSVSESFRPDADSPRKYVYGDSAWIGDSIAMMDFVWRIREFDRSPEDSALLAGDGFWKLTPAQRNEIIVRDSLLTIRNREIARRQQDSAMIADSIAMVELMRKQKKSK